MTDELKRARDALAALEPYLDAIICYASTMDEHEPNRLAVNARAAIAAADAALAAAPQPVAYPFRGPCTIKARGGRCICEAEGLGPECIHRDPLIDGYPLTAGLPPPAAPPAPDAQARDAARYRWLQERTVATGLSRWMGHHQFLDAAIDAAMQGDAK